LAEAADEGWLVIGAHAAFVRGCVGNVTVNFDSRTGIVCSLRGWYVLIAGRKAPGNAAYASRLTH